MHAYFAPKAKRRFRPESVFVFGVSARGVFACLRRSDLHGFNDQTGDVYGDPFGGKRCSSFGSKYSRFDRL
mgnify:FL=1